VIVIAVAVGVAVSPSLAHAQETPTPQGLVVIPATLTVSGPPTAASGEAVTYAIDYAFSAANPETGERRASFRSSIAPGARYAGFAVPSGSGECLLVQEAEPTQGFEDIIECGFGEDSAPSGQIAIDIEFDATFSGEYEFSVFVPGTSIAFEDASILAATTSVSTPDALDLPNTGAGSPNAEAALPYASLIALAGAVAVLLGAALRGRRVH
jgi:hypothetical protein